MKNYISLYFETLFFNLLLLLALTDIYNHFDIREIQSFGAENVDRSLLIN